MKIHICHVTNEKWYRFTLRTMYDIIIRKNPETEIKFYVLLDRVDKYDELDAFNAIDGIEVVTKYVDSYEEFGQLKMYHSPWVGQEKHIKFLIPELDIFEGVDRVLYLDIDMLARKDLTDVYNTNLHDKPIGLCRDYYSLLDGSFAVAPENRVKQLESGLMVMDLPKLRDIEFTKQCKDIAPYYCGDVPVVNTICTPIAQKLDPKYQIPFHEMSVIGNFRIIEHWNIYNNTSYETIEELIDSSYLWHFCGDKKRMYNTVSVVKMAFYLSELRLSAFLKTGNVMQWKPEDDMPLTNTTDLNGI